MSQRHGCRPRHCHQRGAARAVAAWLSRLHRVASYTCPTYVFAPLPVSESSVYSLYPCLHTLVWWWCQACSCGSGRLTSLPGIRCFCVCRRRFGDWPETQSWVGLHVRRTAPLFKRREAFATLKTVTSFCSVVQVWAGRGEGRRYPELHLRQQLALYSLPLYGLLIVCATACWVATTFIL